MEKDEYLFKTYLINVPECKYDSPETKQELNLVTNE